ncbi:MAG: UvrD-helicase domain-containing protein, partial [Pseudomonas sp.]
MSFTPAQLQFITEPGHCVALAGPGSGKTTTLIEKIIRLLATSGTKVIAATFTRDGADEMMTRLA